jgi:hypothetical protein
MRGFLKMAAGAALRATKRFLANKPANPYETIIFNAIRLAASQFGTGRAATA